MQVHELEQNYKNRVVDAVQQTFPVEGKKRVLVAKKVWVEDNKDNYDYGAIKKHRLDERTWSVPVKAEVELRDKETGKVVSKKTVTVASIPKVTGTYGFLVNGKEYHLTNQFLLKPGVYNKEKNDGSLASEYHLKGTPFDVRLDPVSKKYYIKVGGAKPDLYPVLKALGVDDATLEERWGKDILDANKKARKSSLTTFARKWTGKTPASEAEAVKLIKERMAGSELDPDVTEKTMGKRYSVVTPDTILDSTQQLLHLSAGKRKSDNSESLAFKKLRTAGDIVGDVIAEHRRTIHRKVRNNLDRTTDISKIIPRASFEAPVINVISNSSLSTYGDQINPLESIVNAHKTTVMGEGGLKSTHAISDAMKLVDPSHLGVVDPIHTPEDAKAGVTLTLSEATKVKNGQPAMILWDIKNRKIDMVSTKDLSGKKIVYPDQIKISGSSILPATPKVDYHDVDSGPGESKIPWKNADYALLDVGQTYSKTTNLVPMLNTVAAVRASMATRQVTQAVPLKDREEPLVQVDRPVVNGTAEQYTGRQLSVKAPANGVVTKIGTDFIMVRPDGQKKSIRVPIPNNVPMNGDKSFLDGEPVVKVGQKVKKGQVLADTNFTKNGVLALGKNLTVAYVPFKGLTFEDGVVVSESAAKKMTSVHLHKKSTDIGKDGKLSKKGFQAHYGNTLTKDNADKLDDEGVIKPGMSVQPGDVLVAGLRKAQPTTEQEMLKRLSRSLVKPYSNAAVTWDKQYPGVVTDVVKRGGKVKVMVKTEQPLEPADKIVGRFANKGIVTAVIPDNEMPKTSDGKPVDVIMNPMTVPGRINLGQVLETAASKVADKAGKPYKIPNFSSDIPSVIDKVQKDLKKAKVKDVEPLYDPKTGKKLGEVQVGKQYIYKLKHMVETKATARAGGAGYAYDMDRIPKGGGPEGAKSIGNLGVYGMLSHGLYKNLQEMHTWKADMTQADELWRAIQQGLPPPAPRPTFAYEKFTNLLRAVGVDTNKDGNGLVLSPMTDEQVKKMSAGAIKDPGRMVLAKDPTKPEKGGLFDPTVTGGLGGDKWAHIKLSEPMPNPVFEPAIRSLLGVTQSQFQDLVSGKLGVDTQGNIVDAKKAKHVGGDAVKYALKKVDVDSEIKKLESSLPGLRKDQLDKANKKLKYLKNLQRLKMTPDKAYTMKYLPVLPPKFRPLSVGTDGSIVRDGVNELYKGVGLINSQLGDLKGKMPDGELQPLRQDMYDALKAYAGLGTHPQLQYRGVLGIVSGKSPEGSKLTGQPKQGYFQKKLIGSRQDMSLYSTITPNPQLGLDEVGLPEPLAMKAYSPFVVRKLTQLQSVTPLQARQMIKKNDEAARAALRAVAAERPVLLKRDPVLHRYGVMAFKPKIVSGKTIQIHPLVTGGFNADFDGDQQIGTVLLLIGKEFEEAAERVGWKSGDDLKAWIGGREVEMAARFEAAVGYKKGDRWIVCDLEDFPRSTLERVSGHIEFWAVPAGIKVVAWDEENSRPVLADVAYWSVHRGRKVEVVTLKSGSQIFSDDDPRAVYGIDPETLQWRRATPEESKGLMVPVVQSLMSIEPTSRTIRPVGDGLTEEVRLNFGAGYFFGALSASMKVRDGKVSVTVDDAACADKWISAAKKFCPDLKVTIEAIRFTGEAWTRRVTVQTESLNTWIRLVAEKGKLPPFYMSGILAFQSGLVSGIWDSIGTVSLPASRNSPSVLASLTTSHLRLLREVQLLLGRLVVKSTITRRGDRDSWILTVHTNDLRTSPIIISSSARKAKILEDLYDKDGLDKAVRSRDVPVPSGLAVALNKALSGRLPRRLVAMVKAAAKTNRMPKVRALEILSLLESTKVDHRLFDRWKKLVQAPAFFDEIIRVDQTDLVEDGYDLTVPGYETFMTPSGVVLSNTMSAYVPISQEAVQEAWKATPSRNLFSVATGQVLNTPTKEMMTGLFLATKPGKSVRKSFKSVKDAQAAVSRGEISYNDTVTIKGRRVSTAQAVLQEALPPDLRRKYAGKVLDKSLQKKMFYDLAKKHPQNYSDAINKIKDLSNDFVYQQGFSLSLDDYKPDVAVRDKFFSIADAAAAKAKDPKKKAEIYDKATTAAYKNVVSKKAKKPDNLFLLTLSGVKPGPEQYRQIVLAPGLVTNPDGSINPRPIKKSYSEGLGMADYWTATAGARRGIILKVQSVTEPGALTKQMMNSVLDSVVVDGDCDSGYGISEDVTSKSVLNRVLAKPVKMGKKTIPAGTVITPDVASRLRSNRVKKVVVHSPLRCVHGSDGICSKCYGLDATGNPVEPGTNVGVIAAQSLGERTMQLTLKAFHGGGVVPFGGTKGSTALYSQMGRINQLLNVPKVVPDAAPLAQRDGVVEDIRKDSTGGWRVKVSGVEHYVPPKLGQPKLVVKGKEKPLRVGMKVQKGDPLAPGPVNPHDLLDLKGVEPVQRYLTDELYKIYEPHGIDKRHVEVVVGAMTNIGVVEDPGDIPGFVRGDPVKLSTASWLNKQAGSGAKKMKVTPKLRGVSVAPFDLTQDWMALLNHQRLTDTVVEAAQQGWVSDLGGTNPIPPLVLGKNIGDKYKKR